MSEREDDRDSEAIRPATLADGSSISHLLRHLHPDRADAATLPHVRQEAQTFVATRGEGIVGVAVATLVDYGIEAYGTVEELVVDPDHRQRGVGATLVDRCTSWLRESGAEVVFVSALDEDVARFYIASGFSRCTGPWLFWTPGEPASDRL